MKWPALSKTQQLPALLMAATTAWALIFYVATLTNLGGRYRLHPDDPSQIPPLPALDLSQAHSVLQSQELYAEVGERPLFNPDRRPLPVESVATAEDGNAAEPPPPVAPLNVMVTSILLTPNMKVAIVTDQQTGQSQSVKVGESLKGDMSSWTLKELEGRKAVFSGPGGTSSVDLRVFDGAGGQAPTPMTVRAEDNGSAVAEPPVQPGQAAQAPAEPAAVETITPEQRSEMIRRRIEERRRQMRAEAERANNS